MRSINILENKKTEHGSWEKNKVIFQAIYRAVLDEVPDLPMRLDHEEFIALWQKQSRILSGDASKCNPDNWLDIAGYSALRYNNICPDNQLQLKLKS